MARVQNLLLVPAVVAALALAGVSGGCATPRLDDPPLSMEIYVTGLRQDERLELRDRVCALDGVSDCLLVEPPPSARRRGRKRDQAPPPPAPEARITFSYRGSLGNLRWRISQLPHPGLEALRADVRLGYRGFDNKAPTITIVAPPSGEPTAKTHARVVVRVPDVDLAAVEIGDEDAVREGEDIVATVTELKEGENPIVVKATDQAGNVAEATVTVVVDTTPPAFEVEVEVLAYDKAVVRGKADKDCEKLTVDGLEVKRDLFGAFEKEIAVDPDKTVAEVVCADELGNARKIRRSVKIASPMSDQSK